MNDNFTNSDASDLFGEIVGGIVRHKSDFRVDAAGTSRTVSIVFKFNDEDFGIICGTNGQMFKSLVTIARAISERTNQRIIIEELPHPSQRFSGNLPPVPPNPNWKPDSLRKLLDKVLRAFCVQAFSVNTINHSGKITFEVTIDNAEPWKDDPAMQLALTTIFHALGRPQGGHVKVVYIRAERSAEPQPTANRGRFCKGL